MDGFVNFHVSNRHVNFLCARLISETYKYFLCTKEKAKFPSTLFNGVAVVVVFICRFGLSIGTFVRLNICISIFKKMVIFALLWVFLLFKYFPLPQLIRRFWIVSSIVGHRSSGQHPHNFWYNLCRPHRLSIRYHLDAIYFCSVTTNCYYLFAIELLFLCAELVCILINFKPNYTQTSSKYLVTS